MFEPEDQKNDSLVSRTKKINRKVYDICLFGSTNKKKNPIASYADRYHQETVRRTPKDALTQDMIRDMYIYINIFYEPGRQPTSAKDRTLFIQQTIFNVCSFSLTFGYGNCAPMTDIAFLEAIRLKIPGYNLTYIRFFNNRKASEELNVIAFGEFPQARCFIVSPWEGSHGMQYDWNKTIKDTPHLRKEGYNDFKILFKLEYNSEEWERYKAMLVQYNYDQWLADPSRKKHINSIRKYFLEPREQAWKKTDTFQKKELVLPFLSYRDLLLYKRTTKTLHKKIEEIDEEVSQRM